MDQDRQAVPPHQQENIASVAAPGYTIDSFGRIIFIIVLVEIILLVGLNLYQNSRIKTLTAQITDKQSQLQSTKYKTINSQVDEVLSGQAQLQAALNSKVNWSKFYAQLNAITPKNVQLSTMSIAANGSFKADGRTASLDSLAKAMVAWQQGVNGTPTPFSSISLSNNGFTSSGSNRQVSFSITGQINLGGLR